LGTDHQSVQQELAGCHVTRQRCSVATAPKLSGREKLLPCTIIIKPIKIANHQTEMRLPNDRC